MECDYAFERTCRIFPEKKSINNKHQNLPFIHPPKLLLLLRETNLETGSFVKGTVCFGVNDQWRAPLERNQGAYKQQLRRKRKRHLKSEFELLQTYSISFNPSNVSIFFGAEFWRTVPKFRKRKRKWLSRVPVPRQNVNLGTFTL